MTVFHALQEKLRFVEQYYRLASGPFDEIMGKIVSGETPYEPPATRSNAPEVGVGPEDLLDGEHLYDEAGSDDPPFIENWIEMDESLNMLGCSCLCMVQSALLEYLRAYIEVGGGTLPPGKGSLLLRYREFFRARYGFDWSRGPVPFEVLEDLTLARNGIQHGTKITSRYASVTEDHAKRFPESPFGNIMGQVVVTKDTLTAAIAAVEDFCSAIDQGAAQTPPAN